MISTNVTGGVPMSPLQASFPSQSPVSQDGFQVFEAKLQPVLAQILPLHDHGARIFFVWLEER